MEESLEIHDRVVLIHSLSPTNIELFLHKLLTLEASRPKLVIMSVEDPYTGQYFMRALA